MVDKWNGCKFEKCTVQLSLYRTPKQKEKTSERQTQIFLGATLDSFEDLHLFQSQMRMAVLCTNS